VCVCVCVYICVSVIKIKQYISQPMFWRLICSTIRLLRS